MSTLSSRQVAQMLGITHAALSKYIKTGKIPAPKTVTSGRMTLHLWSEKDIELIRQLLPKIANGRKTRYQKQGQRKKPQKKPKR
jgi:predicted transcriptional regulator